MIQNKCKTTLVLGRKGGAKSMTLEQILEIIERYKLRIPPTVYYELLADVREAEEEQEPKTRNFTKADIDAIDKAINEGWELRVNEILSKIRAEIEKLRPNLRPEQMTDYDYAMVEVVYDIVAISDKCRKDKEQE